MKVSLLFRAVRKWGYGFYLSYLIVGKIVIIFDIYQKSIYNADNVE